jgi:hypothetical protein
MTVKQLIEDLSGLPKELEVRFAYDYGDYWHSQVAKEVKTVEIDKISYSEYHRMFQLDEDGDNQSVILS